MISLVNSQLSDGNDKLKNNEENQPPHEIVHITNIENLDSQGILLNPQFDLEKSMQIDGIEGNLNVDNNEDEFEFEKSYGHLFRTIDVKFMKYKIWGSLQNLKDKYSKDSQGNNENNHIQKADELPMEIDDENILHYENSHTKNKNEIRFKDLYYFTKENLDQENKKIFSDSTCFVCLLHLANEKSNYFFQFLKKYLLKNIGLELNQLENTLTDFTIKFSGHKN